MLCKSFETPVPGPGAYDSNSSIEAHGPVTYKSPRFKSSLGNSPGPGHYGLLSSKSSGMIFSTSPRGELFSTPKSPGPGRYDSSNQFHSPSYSMQGKKIQKNQNTPGPGAYSPKFIVKKSTTRTIGNAKRTEIVVALDTPGPGSYQNNKIKDTPSWSFHGTKDTSFSSAAPGPGRYETVNNTRTSTGYSTPKAERPQVFKGTANPGPGAYEAFDLKSSRIKYSIGKAKRPGVASKTPGPGRYEPKSLSHSFSSNFGTETKKTLVFGSEAPAAGTYTPKDTGKKAPAFTMGKRIDKKPDNGVPGPGAYNSAKKVRSPIMRIGKSMRFIKTYSEKDDLEKPGPGNYDPKNENFKGKFFISKSKKDFVKVTLSPGPGHYNVA